MKTNYTPTPLASFLALAQDRKLAILDETKHWYEVRAAKGRKVYLPKDSDFVTRCDLSGFEMPEGTEGVRQVKKPFAMVKQQLDFSGRTQDQVLATFGEVLDYMATLPKLPKRQVNASKGASSPKLGPPTVHDALALEVSRLTANGMHILQAVRVARENMAEQEILDAAKVEMPASVNEAK